MRVLIAALPVVGIMTVASTAAVVSVSSGVASADVTIPATGTPPVALACSVNGINVGLPTVLVEGTLTPNPVNSGSAVTLGPTTLDHPNTGLAGVTLLNGPDTGLGMAFTIPAAIQALASTPGESVGFSGNIPLTVTGGTTSGSPSLSLSGAFTVPATFPASPAVAIDGTQSGTITAGASGTVSVGLPQFTTTSPLTLNIILPAPTGTIPLSCTDSAAVTIDSATITPTPYISASPSSYGFISTSDTTPITISGGNWAPGTPVALSWTTGTDTGSCTTDASGNIPAGCTIAASEAGEVGYVSPATPGLQTPFVDNVKASGTNVHSLGATAQSNGVLLNPFVALNTFCVASNGGLSGLTTPPTPPATGTPPENPLTITRGQTTPGYPTPLPTPSVGCDPKQQIDVNVLGSYLYIWENQTGHNPDAAHVGGLSPIQLGLDTNSSVDGGNLPPCSPFLLGAGSPTSCAAPDPFTGPLNQPVPVNNGQFDQSLGQLNTVTVQDDRGTLKGWTVTGQLTTDFENQGSIGPAVDNVIPADFLTWDPSGCPRYARLAAEQQRQHVWLPGLRPRHLRYPPIGPVPACVGPSGTPAFGNVTGGAPVNGTGAQSVTGDNVPAEVFAGSPDTLNNLEGSADVLCATNLSLAGGAAGGGGTFDCSAGLSLAVPPYVAAGDYRTTMDITILGF